LGKGFHRITSSFDFIKKRSQPQRSNVTIDELSNVLELTSDDAEKDKNLLKGIVNFGHTVVSEVMCPRINVVAADIKNNFDKIIQLILESEFSRIPVYSDTLDSIKGVLYAKDILPYVKNSAEFEWQTLLRPPYFVPETKKINVLLKEFQTKKIHMAVVIDEYGGTAGIVTMEDILEEIVGEITDESDVDEMLYRKLDQSTYIFKGQILLDDFCKAVNIKEDYFDNERGESETLAGLLLEITGEIPQKGNIIEFDRFKFSVESADKRRIKEVRVKVKKEKADAENI
jgi:gliding motility-associated protein GldE